MPHYEHDCPDCRFVRSARFILSGDMATVDVYLCTTTHGTGEDVVLRYGDGVGMFGAYRLADVLADFAEAEFRK